MAMTILVACDNVWPRRSGMYQWPCTVPQSVAKAAMAAEINAACGLPLQWRGGGWRGVMAWL